MNKRKGISKKLRFAVFERNNFTCQYCGRTPENDDVVLNVDHIVSVKNGGENDFENLITSCFECNIGKGAKTTIKAKQTPETMKEELIRTKERMEQVLAMNATRKKIGDIKKKIKEQSLIWIKESMSGEYNEKLYSEIQKTITRNSFNTDTVLDALSITESKHISSNFNDIKSFVSYFFGVCRNLSLSEDEKGIVTFWNKVFTEHRTIMFSKTREFILSKSHFPIEAHEYALSFANKVLDENYGESFKLRSETARLFGIKNYQVYKSGYSFNYLICDCLEESTTPEIE